MSKGNGRTIGVLVSGVPAELRAAIRSKVEAESVSMNDLLVGDLAERFGVRFEPSGRNPGEITDSDRIYLRMPFELKRRIFNKANDRNVRPSSLIIECLSEAFAAAA